MYYINYEPDPVGTILLALVIGVLMGGAYLLEKYPIIALILSLASIVLYLYLLYRIVCFLYRAIRKRVLKKRQKRALE